MKQLKTKNNTVDSRTEMKRIRTFVKKYMSNLDSNSTHHLGQVATSMPKAKRIIIALQDQLQKEIEAHKRASDLVRGYMQKYIDTNTNFMKFVENNCKNVSKLIHENEDLKEQIKNLKSYNTSIEDTVYKSDKENTKLYKLIKKLNTEKDAMMVTLKSSFKGKY